MRIRLLTFIAGGIVGLISIVLIIILVSPITGGLLNLHSKNLNQRQVLALRDGEQSIIYVEQFMALYPDSMNSFSYYTGEYGSPTLNSKIGLYGRYILSMQIPVTFNEERTSIRDYGLPLFRLDEIDNVIEKGDRLFINHGSLQMEFGEEKWKLLLDNNGDISVLDKTIQKDHPIKGFENYWSEL